MSPPPANPPNTTDPARWFAEEVEPHESSLRRYLHRAFPRLHGLIQLQALNVKADADTIWLGTGLTRLRQYERSGAEYSIGFSWRR